MSSIFGSVPDNINFGVLFEPSRSDAHKYVINEDSGEVIGVVGRDFTCADHSSFFSRVQENIESSLTASELDGGYATYRTSRNGAWAMCDMVLPSVSRKVTTSRHETTFDYRCIALHGIDGSCSNTVIFGAIDFFCTNGVIRGTHSKLRRKNTSGFSLDDFIHRLEESRESFDRQILSLQSYADVSLAGRYERVKDTLSELMSKRKAAKMLDLYGREMATRGENAFALVSAFTNYSSHNEDNGFGLRKTNNDTESSSMWGREQEVSGWMSSPNLKP